MEVELIGNGKNGNGVQKRALSEQETDLYDRQIRLWGLESQKRLCDSNVLLIGAGILGLEITKNIILAGIKSLTILDNRTVSENDILFGFMYEKSSLNKNRVDSIYETAHHLNQMVELKVDNGSFRDKSDTYFEQFMLVCATECSYEEYQFLNDICRRKNILFMCGDIYGLFGYFFSDLLDGFEYTIEKKVVDESRAKKRDRDGNVILKEEKIVKSIEKMQFVRFADALDATKVSRNDRKYLTSWFYMLKVLFEFHSANNRFPMIDTKDKDIEEMKRIRESLEIDANKMNDLMFEKVFDVAVPVGSIIGGLLSQEIIKSLSRRGKPFHNMVFFNCFDCSCDIVSSGLTTV